MRDNPPPKDASGQCLIGVAWYSPLEWDSIPERVADPMTFQRPYHEWLANAEDTISTLQKEGAHVVRFPFRLDDFLAWCEEHYRAPDAQARATYTAEKTKKKCMANEAMDRIRGYSRSPNMRFGAQLPS